MQLRGDLIYYYTRNNEQMCAVSGAQLAQLAKTGQLLPGDLVWCDGMPAWHPASTIVGLFVSVAPPPPILPPIPPVAPHTSYQQYQPVQQATSTPIPQPVAPPPPKAIFPAAPFGGANFRLIILFAVAACITIGTGVGSLAIGAANHNDPLAWSGSVVTLIGIGLLLAGCVLQFMYLYRAWASIQGLPGVKTSPGKAIGLLFIPIFSIYWIYIAFGKWAKQYNEFVTLYRLPGAPTVNTGLFLTVCILPPLTLIPALGVLVALVLIIVGIITTHQLCRAVNYLKAQSVLS